MSHIVESCPVTKLNGSLSRLHSVDEEAVSWLTIREEEEVNNCVVRTLLINLFMILSEKIVSIQSFRSVLARNGKTEALMILSPFALIWSSQVAAKRFSERKHQHINDFGTAGRSAFYRSGNILVFYTVLHKVISCVDSAVVDF